MTGAAQVTVTPMNDAPVASDGELSTLEDSGAAGTLSASDGDGDGPVLAQASGLESGPGSHDITHEGGLAQCHPGALPGSGNAVSQRPRR